MEGIEIRRSRLLNSRTSRVPFSWTYTVLVDGERYLEEVDGRTVSLAGSHTLDSARLYAKRLARLLDKRVVETWRQSR